MKQLELSALYEHEPTPQGHGDRVSSNPRSVVGGKGGPRPRDGAVSRAFKRLIDLTVSLAGLILLSPLLLLVAAAILVSMGRPVFFLQLRPGFEGRPFRLCKFRTMREAIGAYGSPLPDADRLTRLGRFLRRTSLDEFPQLWNVLRGDLSLVGPRPLLMRYLPHYSPEQSRRHEVRPGITGWAQVNGRNAIGWEEKFRLDVWYVDHWSLLLDLKILLLTVIKVLRNEGISAEGHATVEPFHGSDGVAI